MLPGLIEVQLKRIVVPDLVDFFFLFLSRFSRLRGRDFSNLLERRDDI